MSKTREKELEQQVANLRQQVQFERAQKVSTEHELLSRLYPYLVNELEHYRQLTSQQEQSDAPVAEPDTTETG